MKKLVGFVVGMLALSFCIMGCTASNKPEVALSIVVGAHANAPEFSLDSQTVKDAIYLSCCTYGNVSFVGTDGAPSVFYQTKIPVPETDGLSKNKKKTIAMGYTTQLLDELSKVTPVVSEVDTLKAIGEAAKTLYTSSEESEKEMLIMDSGLSTCGYLDFTKGLLNDDVDTDSIILALKEAEAIPVLQDIKIVWMYNGQTASPQSELSERQKAKLQEIWKKILFAGGAKEVKFTSDIASDSTNKSYPFVSVVDVEDRSIEVTTETKQTLDTVVLDAQSVVKFVPDKATFLDYEAADDKIKEIAGILSAYPNNTVYILGTTASGEKEFCKNLSLARAEAVVASLKSYGVPESQMIPLGLGYEDPWHVADLNSDGRQIEEKACQNRKVMVIDVNSVDADKLN